MANEFQMLPNPDYVPGKVSSGYQRQNTNMYVLQTGLDTTEPYDDGAGTITVPMGGVVEINGSMFKLGSTVVITKPVPSRAYWLGVVDSGGGTASLTLLERPGTWNPAKQGCYTTGNIRTLNWVSLGTPSGSLGTAVFSQAVKGTWDVVLRKGWYYAELRSGLGGGNGGDASGQTAGTGGVASARDTKTGIFFWQGGSITAKIGGDGGNGGNGGSGSTNIGSGGGGGSGSGEKTEIVNILSTKKIKAGSGGNAGNSIYGGGGGGGSPSGAGINGGDSGGLSGGRSASINSTGGVYGGGNGIDGAGGGQGLNGEDQPDGAPGGSCRIYRLEN
jgi:hypothetical protein